MIEANVEEIISDVSLEYPFEMKIREVVYKFRAWKVSDKKKYLATLSKIKDDVTDSEKLLLVTDIRKNLVKDCVENCPAITPDEYQCLLVSIRSKSVDHEIELTLMCDECEKEYQYKLDVEKSVKGNADNFKTISVKYNDTLLNFEMGVVKSQKVYDDFMSKSESAFESLFVDLVLHVQMINGKLVETEDKFKLFNHLDAFVFEDIMIQWEPQRFKIDCVIGVVCTHCSHAEDVLVDDIPGFFPESWIE